ncbi:Trm112 family protein [Terracoccus sp. 273MFTsu3.1]|uniref:Trm112 family protein n=1 Tax=Terracoccus sp. 273MFTsu3.1 TaxID=1172188 RepID=UPI00037CF601|nr:Trm112 family protein [Terracoccus sp. 273MFTsu3.1]
MSQSQQTIEPWLRGILRCPQCKGELVDAVHAAGEHADPSATAETAATTATTATAELRCDACHLAYPVEGGVPVLLVDLARRTDG